MSEVASHQKGVDRCDAVSYQELLDQDPIPAPDFLKSESPLDLGVAPIAANRYTSEDFFEQEVECVWLKTWQYVCRQEEIPNPGDTTVFDIVGHSAIVVRQPDDSIRAFRNVCLHRGRKLVTQSGSKRSFVCPYHGFSWNTDGSFRKNPMKWDFPQINEKKFCLPEIRVESWGGFIFINFDWDAPSVASVAEPMPEHFAHWGIENCYKSAHVSKVVPANWKAVVEAFLESHHVLTTHPQISTYTGDANSQYDVLSDHVDRFITPLGVASPLIDSKNLTDQKIAENWLSKPRRSGSRQQNVQLKSGQTPRALAAELARENFGQLYGRDFSNVSETEMIDAISYQLFPSFGLWGGYMPHIAYRWRPWRKRVGETLLEVYIFSPTPPEGEEPAPAKERFLSEDEPWSNAPELGYLGPVYDQDQQNLGPVQQGLEDLGNAGVVQFGRYSEIRLRHLHQMIDRYIASGPNPHV